MMLSYPIRQLPLLCCCSLTILACWKYVVSAGASSVVHLQEDGVARHDSGLTWHDTLPTLTTFTLCVRLYSLRSRYSDYFFSYAVEDNDNELAFHLKYKEKELRLACCSKRIFQKVPVNLELLSWFSFCAAVNLSDYTATFVHNKGSVDRFTLFDSLQESNNPILVVSGGSVVLGQDQDEPLGGTDKGQSFNGFIADLFFTQSLLTVQQMKDYLECKIDALLARQHLMDFENIEEKFMLGVETNVTTSLDICSSGNKLFSVFAEGRTNKQANHFCSTVNGDVATPENTAENLALFNIGAKFADKCTEYDKGNSMWVGVYWEPEESLWKDQKTHKEAVYRNFEVEIQPSSREVLCVIASTLARSPEVTPNGNWDIEACGKVVCTACQFKRPVPMKLRGLCKESFFDREYYIYDTINYRPIFNGNSWSRIIWNVNQSAPHDYSWLLYQMGDPYIQARMVTSSILTYPVGLHEFEIIGDKCPGRLKKLKLTSCGQNMFTCGDGMCINLNLRCNLELDCEDHSDELNCESLIIPPGYKKRLPPPKVNSYTPASVFIDCDIVLVRKLDLLNSQITMDVVIKRTWYDSRLYYKNLHPDNNLNQIDTMDSVWYPDVTMLGSDYSQATYVLHRTAVWGQLTASPLPDDDQLIDEDVFYSGKVNPLVLEREFTITLMCTFDLTLYPFDSQHCQMVFYVGAYTQQYVVTSLKNVTFSGNRQLLEYRVTSLKHQPLLYQNKSGQHIEIELANLYGYYISGAYVPTMLLVIISYLTFYFSLDDFTNRVMVSLTSLLVLAALFSQIASGLPKTAYLKLIDVWFIFCIMSDFVMVSVLVIINSYMQVQMPIKVTPLISGVHGAKRGSQVGQRPHLTLDPRKWNTIAQVVLPLLMILFIIVYFGFVAFHMGRVQDEFEK